MSEAQEPQGPLENGLRYHTIVQHGRMLHVGDYHLMLADFTTGGVMVFGWDEVLVALVELHQKQEEQKLKKGEELHAKKEAGPGAASISSAGVKAALSRIKRRNGHA